MRGGEAIGRASEVLVLPKIRIGRLGVPIWQLRCLDPDKLDEALLVDALICNRVRVADN